MIADILREIEEEFADALRRQGTCPHPAWRLLRKFSFWGWQCVRCGGADDPNALRAHAGRTVITTATREVALEEA